MITINPTIYEQLSELLLDTIDSKSYTSETIYFEDEQVDYQFSASLMIYYRDEVCPEGTFSIISDIVPVWWEFHSTTEEGEELNDFDFNIIKRCLCR